MGVLHLSTCMLHTGGHWCCWELLKVQLLVAMLHIAKVYLCGVVVAEFCQLCG